MLTFSNEVSNSIYFSGILDAAVMGGIRNYEEVFFTTEYESRYAEDKILIERLKDLIAEQVPLLDLCVQIHKQKAPGNLQPLQNRFEECFAVMKLDIEEKYGKKVPEPLTSPPFFCDNIFVLFSRIVILNSKLKCK